MTVFGGADFPLARTGGGFSVPIERPRVGRRTQAFEDEGDFMTGDAEISVIRRRKPAVHF
jgi:hypothetical protein